MPARLEFLSVGQPVDLVAGERVVKSAIRKSLVQEPCWLGENGLTGDQQADLVNHAGPDKAVCVYPIEHYPHWETVLGKPFGNAPFGENFSVSGLVEADVCVGDRYSIGEAIVEVSQPRIPCFKLGARHNAPDFPEVVMDSRWTGYYVRCLVAGHVKAGDVIELTHRPEATMSIVQANEVLYNRDTPLEQVRALLSIEALAASWHRILGKRLA